MLERPRTDQPHYGRHLDDPGYWAPYVLAVLRRHHLPITSVEAPFPGSFPTFLVGDLVVKLFGDTFDGPASHAAELAMHELLAGHPAIAAPALVAAGHLFQDAPAWPYLVTERLAGVAVRDAELTGRVAGRVADELGHLAQRLHALEPPPAVRRRNLVPRLRATAAERLRRFDLPEHLLTQVPTYLRDAPAPDTLVHADITADHVFVDGGALAGVIDWGDAIVADRCYELVALYLDAFAGRRELLERFLYAYGWSRPEDFPRRALQAVLEFQFDAIATVRDLVDLDAIEDLDELAVALFG